MTTHPLDNPVWSSLTSHHGALAVRSGNAARYAADVAPFVGVASGEGQALLDVERLVDRNEEVCFVGIVPELSSGWRIEESVPIAQMICEAPLDVVDGPNVVSLADESGVADMLALTRLVYPHYFRPRTVAMGRYVGLYEGRRLAAMAGERMHCEGHCEISAVCTHPDFLGRGYARRLIAMLTNDILDRGEIAFLHFSHANTRAKSLYERVGFRHRSDIRLCVARRL